MCLGFVWFWRCAVAAHFVVSLILYAIFLYYKRYRLLFSFTVIIFILLDSVSATHRILSEIFRLIGYCAVTAQ